MWQGDLFSLVLCPLAMSLGSGGEIQTNATVSESQNKAERHKCGKGLERSRG